MWVMWISYPQKMWISFGTPLVRWKVWISYPQSLWINEKEVKWQKKTELSTVIVDNSVEKCAHVHAAHFKEL
jgi:hypothetical protein